MNTDAPPEVWILMIGDRKSIWEDEQEEILARLEAELGRPRHSATELSK